MGENEKNNRNKLDEYLSYFASISNEISTFPFELDKVTMDIQLEPDLHRKIHREIELLLHRQVLPLSEVPEVYDIVISDVKFRFSKT